MNNFKEIHSSHDDDDDDDKDQGDDGANGSDDCIARMELGPGILES